MLYPLQSLLHCMLIHIVLHCRINLYHDQCNNSKYLHILIHLVFLYQMYTKTQMIMPILLILIHLTFDIPFHNYQYLIALILTHVFHLYQRIGSIYLILTKLWTLILQQANFVNLMSSPKEEHSVFDVNIRMFRAW